MKAIAEAKRELRRQVLACRDALSPDTRQAASRQICHRVAESPEFRRAATALLFASFGSEVSTAPLLEAALAQGKRVVLPRVNPATRELELREVRNLTDDLVLGQWGIPEPIPGRCPEVPLGTVDFVLVPGVAFDRRLRRLGYGGGYYDRVLAETRGVAIALAFDVQLVPEVPTDDHDLHVPVLITERERIDSPCGAASR